MKQEITLIEGMVFEPLFQNREQYERFREEFYREVKSILDTQRIARAESEEAARHHYVD